MRRVKRKAREEIAGGVADMQLALTALDDTIPVAVRMSKSTEDETALPAELEAPPKPRARPGQIGEGKGVPLTQKQRKRAL
jgi:ribosome biogenesis protein SLX9